MESGADERTLEWVIEAVSPVEIRISPSTDLYFEITEVEEPEVEVVITRPGPNRR